MSTSLSLPCGYEFPGGVVERRIEVGKIKGKVQRDVARLAGKKKVNPAALNDAVLKPTVMTIGENPADSNQINNLLLADRDWLIFQLHKATRGSVIEARHKCSECDETSDYHIDIDDLPITRLEDDIDWWDGEKVITADHAAKMTEEERKVLKCRVLALRNESLDVQAVFRFPRGYEQREMGSVGDQAIDAIWKLMSVCLLYWKDEENEHSFSNRKANMIFWDDVDGAALTWAQEEFTNSQPGLENRIEVMCANGHTDQVGVSAIDFLFPKLAKKGSAR